GGAVAAGALVGAVAPAEGFLARARRGLGLGAVDAGAVLVSGDLASDGVGWVSEAEGAAGALIVGAFAWGGGTAGFFFLQPTAVNNSQQARATKMRWRNLMRRKQSMPGLQPPSHCVPSGALYRSRALASADRR